MYRWLGQFSRIRTLSSPFVAKRGRRSHWVSSKLPPDQSVNQDASSRYYLRNWWTCERSEMRLVNELKSIFRLVNQLTVVSPEPVGTQMYGLQSFVFINFPPKLVQPSTSKRPRHGQNSPQIRSVRPVKVDVCWIIDFKDVLLHKNPRSIYPFYILLLEVR